MNDLVLTDLGACPRCGQRLSQVQGPEMQQSGQDEQPYLRAWCCDQGHLFVEGQVVVR